MESICIYCGSSDKIGEIYVEAARMVGRLVAERGLKLVYGAGSTGLMGAVADGVLAAGGEVIGIITEQFDTPVLAYKNLTRKEVVEDMHQRKARMADLADAFIALPGGYGTLEELFEILTWAQIGLHSKPVGILNTNRYFDHLLNFMKQMGDEGFIYKEHRELFSYADTPQELLNAMEGYQPPKGLDRWVEREGK
jgi:uncharacterized protein (TIGR00730 family)